LYSSYNRRELVHPDPLEFLYEYPDPRDREVVGLVASALAFGRVSQILKSVSAVLSELGRSPREFIASTTARSLGGAFKGFKHRWTTGEDVSRMLAGVKNAIEEHGTLEACFRAGMKAGDRTVVPALESFSRELSGAEGSCEYLLPSPERGSACKRMNLYLRWMVRHDEVDPGGWEGVPAAKLVVPLDTHMFRIGRALGFTSRRQADLRAAFEITTAFARIAPGDPVRYDFCLTRLGMRDNRALEEFLSEVDEMQC
jgi:uncharacterized protein (TIGR02757 family)